MGKKSGGSGSSVTGGRRGSQVVAEMSMGKAKSLQKNSGSKPTLGTGKKGSGK